MKTPELKNESSEFVSNNSLVNKSEDLPTNVKTKSKSDKELIEWNQGFTDCEIFD